jgi:hypothetical protein
MNKNVFLNTLNMLKNKQSLKLHHFYFLIILSSFLEVPSISLFLYCINMCYCIKETFTWVHYCPKVSNERPQNGQNETYLILQLQIMKMKLSHLTSTSLL